MQKVTMLGTRCLNNLNLMMFLFTFLFKVP